MRKGIAIAAVLAAAVVTTEPAAANDYFTGLVTGAGAGAVSGGVIAGPAGAVVGGVIGGVVGGHIGERWHDRYTYGRARDRCWRDRYGRRVCEGRRW